MDWNKYCQKQALSELGFLSEILLGLLEEYNIHTLGELYGATRGLTNVALFAGFEEKDEIIKKLAEKVPPEVLEKYKTFYHKHPTGLLKSDKNENNSPNNY